MSTQGGKVRRGGAARDLLLLAALGFVLAACASGPGDHEGHRSHYRYGQPSYKVGPAYQINGVWYYPKVDYSYDETGTASWYGEAFDGHATANGEVYDMNGLSAAHKTLPLPSVVEVTNLNNGRALRLRVNDRGPYVDGRIIDLSRRAAQLLGFETSGTTPVRVRILREESIQVAQAAMRGETGPTMVAQAASTASVRPAPVSRLAAAPRPAPVVQPVAVAALPDTLPPQRYQPARTEPPRPEPQTVIVAASTPIPNPPEPGPSPRRSWPSLISQAHADTLRPPIGGGPAAPLAHMAAAPSSGRIFVQAGAFAMPENAQRVRSRIASLGSAEVVPVTVNGASLYRVRLGPVANEAEADRLLSKVVGVGYPTARVVSE